MGGPDSNVERMHAIMDHLQRKLVPEMFPNAQLIDVHDDVRSHARWFGYQAEGAPTLVISDVSACPINGDWPVNFSTAIAAEAVNIRGALRWANDKNYTISHGKLYVSITHNGARCSAIFQHLISARITDMLWGPDYRSVEDYLRFIVHSAHSHAANMAESFQREIGGHSFYGHDGILHVQMNS